MTSIQTMEVKGELTTHLIFGFRAHPNYGNDLRKQYNTILADINDSSLLEDLAKQIAHKGIKTKKVGHIDRDLILNANYMLA